MLYILLFVLSVLFQNLNASEISDLLLKYSHEKYPLHYSIEQKRPDIAMHLLRMYPEQVNRVNQEEHSAFELALQYGYEELALELLDRGFDPNMRFVHRDENRMYYPLYFAIKAQSIRCVQKLLDLRADTTFIYGKWIAGNRDKISAIHLAGQFANDEIFALLLKNQAGCEVAEEDILLIKEHAQNTLDWPALHYAIYSDHSDAFDCILKHGCNPNHTGFCPYSAYKLALDAPNPYYAEKLLDFGFDLDQAMVDAIRSFRVDEIHKISQRHEWMPANYHNKHILLVAIETDNCQVLEAVLQSGVRDTQVCEHCIENFDMMALFIEYNSVSSIALEWALGKKSIETCRLLLDAGYTGYATLYAAYIVSCGIDFVRLFYEHGLGPSMLSAAIRAEDVSMVQYLLESGASDSYAWHWCIYRKRLDLLKLVVSYTGITQDQKNQAIKEAIQLECTDIIEYLLDLGIKTF